MMIVTGLTAIAMVALLSIWKASQRSLQNVSAAASLARVSAAFETYLRVHGASLPPPGQNNLHVVKLSALRANGLDASIPDTNSYGQTYELKAHEPTKGDFRAMVTTKGGRAMSPDDVIEVARVAVARGAAAGYTSSVPPVGKAPKACNGDPSGYSLGAFGDWCIMLSTFAMTPGAGHVQTVIFYTPSSAGNDDALQRSENKSAPERNRMKTSIDMDNNDLKKMRSIVFGNDTAAITGAGSGTIAFATKGTQRMQLDENGQLALQAGTTIKAPAGQILGVAGNWISGDGKGLLLQTGTQGGAITIRGLGANGHADLTVNGDIRNAGRLTTHDIAATGAVASATVATGLLQASQSILSAGRIRSMEYIAVEGHAVANDACKADGLIGLDAAKRTLVHCMAGRWTPIAASAKAPRTIRVLGMPTRLGKPGSEAVCPTDTVVLSAGYYRSDLPSDTYAPESSFVNTERNSAVVNARTMGVQASAICLVLN